MKTFYITTTLPYVNADPHLGHAVEFARADIIARYKRLMEYDVFFNVGTDEHGVKIYRKAEEEGLDPQAYVDEYADRFKKFCKALDISYSNFVRTSDPVHKNAAQEFWKLCDKSGYIYKKEYKIKYCVGCELEKTESELTDGVCPDHPNKPIEIIEEENYFFKFSQFQEKLLDLYKSNPNFVFPESRMHEITKFVERGLQDFSISRLKEKMPWGVAVPGDDNQVMYVWFDALVNYISVLGWPNDMSEFNKWWPVVQIAGKDNLRQQSAMWQAMLMSVGLPPSKQILINGFITSGGQKMSKSLGNVLDPMDFINKYGADALRYFIARELSQTEDSDVTEERFKEAYNANLANGLGNLVSRVMKMAEANLDEPVEIPPITIPDSFKEAMEAYDINKASDIVWDEIGKLDNYIQEKQPFALIKTNPKDAKEVIQELVINLCIISMILNPIMPNTSAKIQELIKKNKSPEKPLFPRID